MTPRQLSYLLGSAMMAFACEELSSVPAGRDDAVRYQLPPNATELLEQADRLEIFALGDMPDEGPANGEHFDDRPILARVVVDERERVAVAAGLYRALQGGAGQGLCFAPHHGVRAQKGAELLELSICYSCLQMKIMGGDDPIHLAIDPSGLPTVLDERIEAVARLRFDRALDHAGGWAPIP